MDAEEREVFDDIWTSACMASNGKRPDEGVLKMVFSAMKDLTFSEVLIGLRLHANNPDECNFWPKPGRIRENLIGSSSSLSQKAWRKVDHAIRCIGHLEDVRFEDAIIMQVIFDMGGWLKFSNCEAEKLSYLENDFKKSYRSYLTRGVPCRPPREFMGRINLDRQAKGFQRIEYPTYEQRLLEAEKKNLQIEHSRTSQNAPSLTISAERKPPK